MLCLAFDLALPAELGPRGPAIALGVKYDGVGEPLRLSATGALLGNVRPDDVRPDDVRPLLKFIDLNMFASMFSTDSTDFPPPGRNCFLMFLYACRSKFAL